MGCITRVVEHCDASTPPTFATTTMDLEPDTIIDFLTNELYTLVQKYPENSELREVTVEWTAQLAALKDSIDEADLAETWAVLKHDWIQLSRNVVAVEPRENTNAHLIAAGHYLNDFDPGAATKLKQMVRRQRHANHHFDSKWVGITALLALVAFLFGGGYFVGYANNGRCDSDQLGRVGNLYYRRYTHGVQCDPEALTIDEPTWLEIERRANQQGLDWPIKKALCIKSAKDVPWHGYLVVGNDLNVVRNTNCSRQGTLEQVWFGNIHDHEDHSYDEHEHSNENDHNQDTEKTKHNTEKPHKEVDNSHQNNDHLQGVVVEDVKVDINVNEEGDKPVVERVVVEDKWEYVPEAGYDYADVIDEIL